MKYNVLDKLSLIERQLIINYQLSTINYQLSIINLQFWMKQILLYVKFDVRYSTSIVNHKQENV